MQKVVQRNKKEEGQVIENNWPHVQFLCGNEFKSADLRDLN